jgi:hypothetical protein
VHPNFSLPFDVHTDASKFQLGAVISQQAKPIAFYSRKLTDAQQRYTIIELELLSIVETLREYCTILLGRLINVYTDHKNLSFNNFTSDQVRRWRLIIEEYGPRIVYLPGSNNIIADALSRLPTNDTTSQDNTSSSIEHIFMSDEFFPLAFKTIATAQQQDTRLQNKLLTNASYEQRIICQNNIIYHENKMVIPQSLQHHILDWYHTFLLHPGTTRMFETVHQHFTWSKLFDDITTLVQHQPHPWNTVAVDLIGPWTIPQQKRNTILSSPVHLLVLSMIDPDTYWTELAVLPSKKSQIVAQTFDYKWLS